MGASEVWTLDRLETVSPWTDLLPLLVLRQQIAWERREMMVRMDAAGRSHKAIAARFGVPAYVVSRAIERSEHDRISPVQRWMDDPADVLRLIIKSRKDRNYPSHLAAILLVAAAGFVSSEATTASP